MLAMSFSGFDPRQTSLISRSVPFSLLTGALCEALDNLGANRNQIPSALEISPSVAFSASLTCTPPPNQPPPSYAASAVF